MVNRDVQAAVEGAEKAGAEVRLRKVAELAPPEAIKSNDQWLEHRKATADVAEATMDDLEWADAVVFGTPTRFGNVSSQLKQYIDQAGPLWEAGKLYGASHTSDNGAVEPGDIQLRATELTATRAVQVAAALKQADLLGA